MSTGSLKQFLFVVFFLLCACSPLKPELSLEQKVLREERVVNLLTQATLLLRKESPLSLDAALASLNLARELSPEDPRVFDGLGCVALRAGNLAAAKQYFQAALNRDANYARGYAHLAYLAELDGNIDQARELYNQAIELNPLDYRIRNNRAVLVDRLVPEKRGDIIAYQEIIKAYQTAPEEKAVIFGNLEKLSTR